MAGDWIKMRLDLQTHPKIVRILSATKSDKFRVIGGLHAVWSVFDTHSENGLLDGYTPETLDHIIGWDGFASAMIGVGWLLAYGPQALLLPEFDEHNGKSGKRRAEDQKRKREDRKSPQSVRNPSADEADEKLTREEKRREEKSKPLKSKAEPRGTRLASDWIAADEYIIFCKTERPDLDPKFMQDKFRDYWHPKPGKDGLKLDWLGTWRNFIRSERMPQARASPAITKPEKFDPTAYVNRNKTRVPDERTIEFNQYGEPI